MGTKAQCESFFQGYFSMRDLNEDSNSCSWPLYYGDRTFTNGQYYNGYLPRAIADMYPGYDKDVVKQTMLEHEATFKNQLCELHRLYRIQRDLMDEAKRKELYKNRMPIEKSLSSSPLASQVTSEDARKWHLPSFPLGNSVCAGPSTSGIEDMHSPLSSMKGSSAQASPLLSQNGGTSKDLEILESRPTKVRRKMFDLQLPADEYIDTEEGEQLRDENACGISSYFSNRNHKVVHENGINLLIGKGGKKNCLGDALQSESFLKSKSNLADLNEPIDVEDTNASANDLLGCTSSRCETQEHGLAAKQKSQFLGFPQEILLNSHHGSTNGTLNNLHLQNNANRKLWFPHMLDSGHSKNNLKSIPQGLQPEIVPSSSQPVSVLLNKTNEPASLFLTDQSKAGQLRGRLFHGSEPSERNKEISDNSHHVSVVASNMPIQYATDPSPNLSKSWPHSISSWEKLSGSLNTKSISVQMHPYFNSSGTLSRSSQSSTQSHGVLGDRWNYTSNSASNLRINSEMPDQNGYYYGSSSGSKELLIQFPSGNRDFLNCSSAHNIAPAHFPYHDSAKHYKSSNCVDSKSAKDVNLNVAVSNGFSAKMSSQQGLEVIDLERNQVDHIVTLPWLRTKPSYKSEATNAGVDLNSVGSSDLESSLPLLSNKSEAGNVLSEVAVQSMKSASPNVVEGSRIYISDTSSCRKILGFPIFEKPHISKVESSSLTSPSVSLSQPTEDIENNRKSRVLDINLPCDPPVPDFGQETPAELVLTEKETEKRVASVRHHIDLNSSITEDEASLIPSVPGSTVKIISGIDLEVPALPETEEDVIPGEECLEKAHGVSSQLSESKAESSPDEFARIAAEAIVAISITGYRSHQDDDVGNPSEASMTDPLHWFVEIASSFGEDLESKCAAWVAEKGQDDEGSSSEDYFESMTLRLVEIKEEDYMPKPLISENFKLEETGTPSLPTRTRRGQTRRGRQRRDFQRDILPGLASLSRHEVTEDLQTFGGLMRATGHLWHSGLTRRNSTRNGCGRGRRRTVISSPPAVIASPPCTPLIQQLSNVEVGLEDRSLTGWGKTTRRPRRQRCPPGNPPALPLT
ncbi:uncharacterized protein LOC8289151 [Ricinus communis]|uniref:Uncharacterized protein n=1 Tax=Ricinus communis TaxID=3988 RepID=B9RCX6_RICCO|nr:uncharacterized protein LOC8289151 [Ricinus communis]EEF50793.1 hypothetical protein RCOM_1621800 [Ricinus communis]|eukprot:XP_002512124.1 uncharacterized protein LOC8289151 [Ricinus communis]